MAPAEGSGRARAAENLPFAFTPASGGAPPRSLWRSLRQSGFCSQADFNPCLLGLVIKPRPPPSALRFPPRSLFIKPRDFVNWSSRREAAFPGLLGLSRLFSDRSPFSNVLPRSFHDAAERSGATSLVLPVSPSYRRELQQLSTPEVHVPTQIRPSAVTGGGGTILYGSLQPKGR